MKTIELAFEGDEFIIRFWNELLRKINGKHVLELKVPDAVNSSRINTGGDEKIESDKKQEYSPKKICGACRHTPNSIIDFDRNQIVLCEKKGHGVPVCFEGCPDFESHSAFLNPQSVSGEGEADIPAYIERIAQLEKENVKAQSLRDEAIEKYSTLALKYSKLTDDYVSLINSGIAYRKKIDSLEEEVIKLQNKNTNLQEEIVWQFNQMTNKIGTLQDQNDRLQRELDAAKRAENDSRLYWNKEHERALQRIKDLEREISERSWPPRPRFFL